MTISASNQAILLSQTGLSFLGVSQGGIVPPQTFGVVNIGTGVVNYTVSKSTLSGGPDWLQIGTTGGTISGFADAAAASVPTVSISVNPSILPQGKYYGFVQVDAPDADGWVRVSLVFQMEDDACECLLGLGTNVEIIEPLELREKVVSRAESVVTFYRQNQGTF